MKTTVTVQAVVGALKAAGVPMYRANRRGPDQPGARVRGHALLGGRVCVFTEHAAEGTVDATTLRVAEVLNASGYAATFDPDHGHATGVVFVAAKVAA